MEFNFKEDESVLCNVETDIAFLGYMREIAEKRKALSRQSFLGGEKIEEEEYDIIDERATRHAHANIINLTTSKELQNIIDERRCTCGCGKGIGEFLPLCTNEQNLSILGSGILLFFFYLRHMRMVMILVYMVYGVYSEITNSFSQNGTAASKCQNFSSINYYICFYIEDSTFVNKTNNLFLMQIQLWLGTLMCLIWMIGLKLITTLGMKKDKEIDDSLDSASDYTIKIDNLPYGQYHENQLIDYLSELWLGDPKQLEFKSIQIVYNMEEYEALIQKVFCLSQQLISCVTENDEKSSNQIKKLEVEKYKMNKKLMIGYLEELKRGRSEFKRKKEIRKKKSTTIALMEFVTQEQKKDFLNKLGQKKNPLQGSLNPTNSILFKGQYIEISRAPEPSDIIWENCEKPMSYFRVVIIWLLTMLILYIGYAVISFVQTLDFVKESEGMIISIMLQLFNRVIWLELSVVVAYECNNTKTESIISLMKKAMIAQAINIICTPMISKFVNNKSLYGYEGLSAMALTYQLVMVLMMLFYYVLNPIYLTKSFCLRVPCLRNALIRRYCEVTKKGTTLQEIKGVLKFYEGPQFPVAGGFVYMTTAIFHALFFCHLQPSILLFVALNMTLFFFIMKYMLYRRCKIPELTNVQVFQFAMFAISWGAVFYGAGSMFFLIIDENIQLKNHIHLVIPSIVCFIIWFVANLNVFGLFDCLNGFLCYHLEQAIKHRPNKVKKRRRFRETINVNQLDEQLSAEHDDRIWLRRESYYRDCNTNKLFDFQSYLRQIEDTQRSRRGQHLRHFCESFFGKSRTSIVGTYVIDTGNNTELALSNNNQEILIPVEPNY